MKKYIGIFLAFLLLNGTTELHQFLKLPLLISHLKEHRSLDPDMTLAAFLKLHYSPGQHPDDRDERDDQELPFRSLASLKHVDILYLLIKESTLLPPEFPHLTVPCIHAEGLPASYSSSIFHPPRDC